MCHVSKEGNLIPSRFLHDILKYRWYALFLLIIGEFVKSELERMHREFEW